MFWVFSKRMSLERADLQSSGEAIVRYDILCSYKKALVRRMQDISSQMITV